MTGNNHTKSIALLIPSLGSGGMERVMSELANYFSGLDNIHVHLVLYGKSPTVFYELDKLIVHHKPKTNFSDNLRIVDTMRRIIYLRRTVKHINPDFILSFGTLWNSFVLLALKGTCYPVFISDRGNPTLKYSYIHEFMRRILYRSAAGIIAQTSVAEEISRKRIPSSNIAVIGNPIRQIDNMNKTISKENIVLSISPLKTTKHHDRLIKIFSKLNAPGWKLLIVGGNALKQNNFEKLQQMITELNLRDKVIMAGKQKNVEEFYLRSKIFAFTSSTEGFPNVVGEALSAGLPVVSYDCVTGPSEMITEGENGFLVQVFDDNTFQKRLQFLIDNEESLTNMSNKAKQSVKKFSIENIGKKYYSFITSLI